LNHGHALQLDLLELLLELLFSLVDVLLIHGHQN
jgi:hypothetical protein